MEAPVRSMSALFDQLGLPSNEPDIDAYIQKHRPLSASTPLAQCALWNEGQRHFLEEALQNDADRTEFVDELDTRLRA
ncbi:DUF2789 family protein [Gilvimarinus sp. SDUM040013]|uniref:DUF2789 family protein n=1 Tax=Gilvimarinus gilvus TaxID=3058038 RepID=A0ABU4RXX0_9GAMM|nr:DUF2789 family protein [Gilvimarinus sp. SDUM040013]MDO3386245.1 DUF2789 family protein [Gilvimarinus sp. SDUM040013]MDX6849760.1 DUF2789 family protein [Gilvimarinus sp. SDUM040013]